MSNNLFRNPFVQKRGNGKPLEAISCADRLVDVQHFNIRQCIAALEQPCIQPEVRRAIQLRIRLLDR